MRRTAAAVWDEISCRLALSEELRVPHRCAALPAEVIAQDVSIDMAIKDLTAVPS